MISKFKYWFIIISLLSLSNCGIFYDFKGISIDSSIKTYYVEDFVRGIADCPVDLDQRFAELLRQKVRDESRLINNETEPDIAFLGTVTSYRTVSVAPEEGSTTSLNRLEIGVRVEYINYLDEEKNWEKRYTAFEDYDSNTDFGAIEESITTNIIDDIVERIFNEAFTNW